MRLLAGCMPDTGSTQSNDDNGASVNVQILSIKRAKHDAHGSLVFGKPVISGKEKIKSANLDCFTLSWNGHESERIHVHSIVSVLTNPFPGKNGEVITNAYWVLPNASLTPQDLNDVRVKKSREYTRCISHF